MRAALAMVFILAGPAVLAATDCPDGARVIGPGEDIQRHVDEAHENTAFCLKAGIYRGQSIRPKSGQRFYGRSGAVLDGARIFRSFAKRGLYWVARTGSRPSRKHGKCADGFEACGLPEGLYVDSDALRQVLKKSDLKRGAFYVDGTNGDVYLAENPRDKRVEFASVAHAFFGAASDVLIDGLTIKRYASRSQRGAIEAREGRRWVIRNVDVFDNNAVGVNLGTGGIVEDSHVHNNGQLGIAGAGREIRIENNVISGNNQNGFKSDWEAGGVKITRAENVVMRGNRVVGNNGPGLWCDIDCRDVVYEGNRIENNANAGIFHEISFSATIQNNVLAGNGHGYRVWLWDADILVAGSQDVEVTGNRTMTIADGTAVALIDQNRTDRPSKRPYKTQRVIVHGNDFSFAGNGEAGGVSDAKPAQPNYAIIEQGGNRFDGNVYRLRHGAKLDFTWGHTRYDWDGFRAQGMEKNGRIVVTQ